MYKDNKLNKKSPAMNAHFGEIDSVLSKTSKEIYQKSTLSEEVKGKTKKIVILIPCYNEEEGIGKVIDDIPYRALRESNYMTQVIVIDNNSKDRTAEISKSKGAFVIKEPKQGKGYAIVKGFRNIPYDADIVVMIDGDNTYDIKEIGRLVELLECNFADAVVGTRLNGKLTIGSMNGIHRIGNWFFTFLARTAYKTNVTDVCSGFFAWKSEVIKKMRDYLESDGFSIEMEMIIKMAKLHYECFSVPISYQSREGDSHLKPFKDGMLIFRTWLKYLKWNPRNKELSQ
ncbi:MAG: glycosyltransferase family 2 protein [Promethearchaeota archaeon]